MVAMQMLFVERTIQQVHSTPNLPAVNNFPFRLQSLSWSSYREVVLAVAVGMENAATGRLPSENVSCNEDMVNIGADSNTLIPTSGEKMLRSVGFCGWFRLCMKCPVV